MSKTDVRVMTLAAIVLLTVCCGSRVQKQATAKEAATKDATDVDTSVADILFVPVRTDEGFTSTAPLTSGSPSMPTGRSSPPSSFDTSPRGWRQRTNQFLNPGIATSFAGGGNTGVPA